MQPNTTTSPLPPPLPLQAEEESFMSKSWSEQKPQEWSDIEVTAAAVVTVVVEEIQINSMLCSYAKLWKICGTSNHCTSYLACMSSFAKAR